MTGPNQEPHALTAAICFFGVLAIMAIDLVKVAL